MRVLALAALGALQGGFLASQGYTIETTQFWVGMFIVTLALAVGRCVK